MTPGAGGERVLIYVPIIHSQADMGGLARDVRRLTVRRLGPRAWQRKVDLVGRMWEGLRRTIEAWDIPWRKVRLYQDGLPVCGREAEIVRSLASAGSPNHALLVALMRRGAALEGTESPALLVAEYRLAREQFAAGRSRAARSRSLLARRDRYIARRIHRTLRPGEIGLLLLGALHTPEPYLARDIRVVYPFPRPQRARRPAP